MDEIQELTDRIRASGEVWGDLGRPTHFSSKFLNTVADIFEREGFGVTEAYLTDKAKEPQSRAQVKALRAVLRLLQECPMVVQRRSVGRLIIKSLEQLAPHKGGKGVGR